MSNFSNADQMRLNILNAVETLLKETSFSKMTVKDICKTANISGPTFYKYFSDKYHIAQWFFDCIFDKWVMQIGRTLTWYQGYYMHCKSMQDCAEIFKAFMAEPTGYQSLPSYGRRRQRQALQETITDYIGAELTDEIKFQIDCLVQIETHTAIDWVKSNGSTMTAEEYAQRLVSVVPHKLYTLLEHPACPLFGSREKHSSTSSVEQLLTNDAALLMYYQAV